MPPPVQRPIPIWFGGSSDAVVKRAARLGDGWMPFLTADGAEEKIGRYHEAVRAAGRDPADAPLHVLCHLGGGGRDGAGDGTIRTAEKVAEDVETWRRAGAGMVIVNTLDSGVGGAAEHLAVYGRIAECLGLARR